MSDATVTDKALLAAPKAAGAPPSSLIVNVARKFGVSPFRQLREMAGLRMGQGKISMSEYYSLLLCDPQMSAQDKRGYVGETGSFELNKALSPADFTRIRAFLRDKVMYSALIQQLGFRTTQTQAVASAARRFGAVPVLATPDQVATFLKTKANYPVFAKPCEGSGSIGSVLITGTQGEELVLGNGRHVPLAAFCEEIFRDYPDGFIFQSALEQHKALADVTGKAIGALRLVTVRREDSPELLYSLWKIPSPSAMSDNFWQDGSMLALVEPESGQVSSCRVGTGLDGRDITHHPVTEQAIVGLQLPHWQEACDMAREAHALFPEIGVVGWDIALTPDGPAIIECNCNPHHVLYQLAAGKGIRNPEFLPVLEAVERKSNSLRDEKIALIKARDRIKRKRA